MCWIGVGHRLRKRRIGRRRLLALVSPHAAAGTVAEVRARRARARSCIAAAASPHAAAGTSTAVCARARARSCLLCTGLGSQESLRARRNNTAIAYPSLAARTQLLSCFGLLSLFGRHSFLFFSRHASPCQHARAHVPRTHQRPTTNNATCVPPAWLTGRLQKEGTRSVRSPLRCPPFLATPIATPLQGGRPERAGLSFLKILYGTSGNREVPRTCVSTANPTNKVLYY